MGPTYRESKKNENWKTTQGLLTDILEKMNNLESLIAETERTKEKTWDNQFYVQILLEFIEYLTSRKK